MVTKELEFKIMTMINNITSYNDKRELLRDIKEYIEKHFSVETDTKDSCEKTR